MALHFDSTNSRVAAGILLCSLAASATYAPGEEAGAAPRREGAQPQGGGRVAVVWNRPAGSSRTIPASIGVETSSLETSGSPSEAFRDPETGRLVEPPADQLVDRGPQRLSAALSTSSEGLVEEPVTASPGGVRVNLRGRFRSAVNAERRPDAELFVECGEPAAMAGATATPPPPAAVATASSAPPLGADATVMPPLSPGPGRTPGGAR